MADFCLTIGTRAALAALIAALSIAAAPAVAATDYPLYCQATLTVAQADGAMSPASDVPADPPMFNLKWAQSAASVAAPPAGECAWADRAPRGGELQMGYLAPAKGIGTLILGLKAGQYVEFAAHSEDGHLALTRFIGVVSPAFPASVDLPQPGATPATSPKL